MATAMFHDLGRVLDQVLRYEQSHWESLDDEGIDLLKLFRELLFRFVLVHKLHLPMPIPVLVLALRLERVVSLRCCPVY